MFGAEITASSERRMGYKRRKATLYAGGQGNGFTEKGMFDLTFIPNAFLKHPPCARYGISLPLSHRLEFCSLGFSARRKLPLPSSFPLSPVQPRHSLLPSPPRHIELLAVNESQLSPPWASTEPGTPSATQLSSSLTTSAYPSHNLDATSCRKLSLTALSISLPSGSVGSLPAPKHVACPIGYRTDYSMPLIYLP